MISSGHFSQGLLRVMENEGWVWGPGGIQDLVSSHRHVLPAAFRVFCFEPGSEGSQVQWRRQTGISLH